MCSKVDLETDLASLSNYQCPNAAFNCKGYNLGEKGMKLSVFLDGFTYIH